MDIKKAVDIADGIIDVRDLEVASFDIDNDVDIVVGSKFKRLAGLLLATLVISSSTLGFATPEIEQIYLDRNITSSIWSREFVANGYQMGLLENTNLYKNASLDNNMNRLDFTEVVMNYIKFHRTDYQLNNIKIHDKTFIDTDNKNIEMAYQLGVINGVDAGVFGIDETLTREQASVILASASVLVGNSITVRPIPEIALFKDKNDISDWAILGVAQMVKQKAISGNDDGFFNPKGMVKQEEAIKIIVELMKI